LSFRRFSLGFASSRKTVLAACDDLSELGKFRTLAGSRPLFHLREGVSEHDLLQGLGQYSAPFYRPARKQPIKQRFDTSHRCPNSPLTCQTSRRSYDHITNMMDQG
jgi:hypothetical protein